MKPVLLLTLEYPPQIGGIAEYLRNIMERLPSHGINVLAPVHHDAHELDVASDVPIYRHHLELSWLRPRWLPLAFWTEQLCRKEHPSLLLVSHLLPAGQVALRQKRKRGIPYVVIVHGMDIALAAVASKRKRDTARKVLRGAALIVANSTYTAGFAEAFGVPKERIMILHPSPSFPLTTVVAPEAIGTVRKECRVQEGYLLLSAGRLVTRKGYDDVIHAVAALKQQGKLVQYLIIGDGPDRKRLENLSYELAVDDRVIFRGSVDRKDLPAYFAACDVLIAPSKSFGADVEGFGTVYLEANLLGKPVIGTRTGGITDAVLDGKTGLLVSPGSPGQLAAAIQRLMDDPALAARLGADGRKRVLDEFDWDRQTKRLQAAFEAITEHRV
jgi:phosphatidylinositol alpha-1,6-mannosyltransferase